MFTKGTHTLWFKKINKHIYFRNTSIFQKCYYMWTTTNMTPPGTTCSAFTDHTGAMDIYQSKTCDPEFSLFVWYRDESTQFCVHDLLTSRVPVNIPAPSWQWHTVLSGKRCSEELHGFPMCSPDVGFLKTEKVFDMWELFSHQFT